MSYLGRALTAGNYLKLDDLSSQFNGTQKTFNLTSGGQAFYPGSAFSILVSLGGVIQEPESAYQINQSQITFAVAPQVSDDFFCIALGVALGVGVPADGTVSGEKLKKPFSYDDGLLYLDDANNRVGINSTAPRTSLDIVGIVSATSFSGSGSGLTGVSTNFVTAIGIQSAGTAIGVGITQLNFIGFGNTFRVNGTTIDISISGNTGAGGTWSSSSVGVTTTKIVGINTTSIAGAANSEGALQVVGNVALTDGALILDQNIDSSVYIPSGKNGLLIGPVSVGLGVTIDVAPGSTLVIV